MKLGFDGSSPHPLHSNKESNEFTNEDGDNEFDDDCCESASKLKKLEF